MIKTFKNLKSKGNTIVVVEHDLQLMQAADHILDMGPDAGRFGGKVVAQGRPEEVAKAQTHTGRWLSGEARITIPSQRKQPASWMKLVGPSGYNLKVDTLAVPLGVLVGICGVSGSGKSTLIHDTLARILAPVKQTTSVAYEPISPEPYQRLEGAPAETQIVDQTRAGLHSPASFLGIEKALRKIFAGSSEAVSLGLDEDCFKRTCSACNGTGRERIEMGFLPDIFETCETCGGSGYPPEAGGVHLHGLTLPEILDKPMEEVREVFKDEEGLTRLMDPALQVGLGYLILGQPGRTLSGGEAQRLKIAGELLKRSRHDSLYILDEPSLGQHLADVQRLIGVLRLLVDEGGSVLVVEHHPHILAACDWLIELGPGGGPAGGEIIAEGTPESMAAGSTPTAPYLRDILGGEA
jgi:excinuclease ABC subunit A